MIPPAASKIWQQPDKYKVHQARAQGRSLAIFIVLQYLEQSWAYIRPHKEHLSNEAYSNPVFAAKED